MRWSYIVAKLIESHSIYLTISLCLWHRQSCLNLSLSTCTSKDLDLEKNLDSSPKSGSGKEHTFLSTQTTPLGGWVYGGNYELVTCAFNFSLVWLVPLAQVWTCYVPVSSVKRTLMIELNCEKNIKNFKWIPVMEITQNSIYMFLTIGLKIMKISPLRNPTHLEGFSTIPRACHIDLPKIFSFDFVDKIIQYISITFA